MPEPDVAGKSDVATSVAPPDGLETALGENHAGGAELRSVVAVEALNQITWTADMGHSSYGIDRSSTARGLLRHLSADASVADRILVEVGEKVVNGHRLSKETGSTP